MIAQDLVSRGFGHGWGHTRSYANQLSANYSGPNGERWFIKEIPVLDKDGSGNVAVMQIINDAVWFDKTGSNPPTYAPRYFVKDTLTEDTTNKEFVYTRLDGSKLKFFNWDVSIPVAKQGKFKSFIDPYGHETVASYDASDRISSFVQGTTTTSGYYYDYYTTGDTTRLQYVTLKRGTTNVRQTESLYYGTGDSNGNDRDLKSVKFKQWNAATSAWDDLATTYYRY